MVDIFGIIDTEGNQSNRTQETSHSTKEEEDRTTDQPCHETRTVVKSCLHLCEKIISACACLFITQNLMQSEKKRKEKQTNKEKKHLHGSVAHIGI